MADATIEGGTLNAPFFGGMRTVGSATLDGLTHGPITLSTGSFYIAALFPGDTTNILGTITNHGTIRVIGGGGGSGVINLSGNATLKGGGTVRMSDNSGSGDAVIQTNQSPGTLTNVDNRISGNGVIGNGGLAVINSGTIEADTKSDSQGQTAKALVLNGSGGVTNSFGGSGGLIEATSDGKLVIGTIVNNQNGNITAMGNNSKVDVMGGTIQGGTLNSSGGGVIETVGSATLDGSTHGALTISANSIYVAARSNQNDTTELSGTIINNGTIQLNGGKGETGIAALIANATLDGTGHIDLTTAPGGGDSSIRAATPGVTLENLGNTIEGASKVGASSSLSINNLAGGMFDANSPGQPLFLNGAGNVTNSGTFQAEAILEIDAPLTNITGSPGTTESLTGGTFTVNNGTMQINSFGSLVGGGELINLAANLTLNGKNAILTDANGFDALGRMNENTTLGSFTIEGGQNYVTVAPIFNNDGTVDIGPNTTFTSGTGGAGTYRQTGGSTTVGGKLNAGTLDLMGGSITIQPGGIIDPLAFNLTGGVLGGDGILEANLTNNGGTIDPGDGMGGLFSLIGDYSQSAGIFQEDLSGNNCGGVGELAITGNAALGGLLDINLENGCLPTTGSFLIMTFTPGGLTGSFVNGPDYFYDNNQFFFTVDYNNALGEVILEVNQSTPVQTPEPGSLVLFGTTLIAVGFGAKGVRCRRAMGTP